MKKTLEQLSEMGIIELPPSRFTPFNSFDKYTTDYCEGFNIALQIISKIEIDIDKLIKETQQ